MKFKASLNINGESVEVSMIEGDIGIKYTEASISRKQSHDLIMQASEILKDIFLDVVEQTPYNSRKTNMTSE